jgi:hypothetical protein
VQITLEGYIIKFVAENHKFFSKEKIVFKEGARGRLLQEIPRCIEVLLVEEGIVTSLVLIPMNYNEIV